MPAHDDADARLLIREMCRACADDLARWALAFTAQQEPRLATLIVTLQAHMEARAAATH